LEEVCDGILRIPLLTRVIIRVREEKRNEREACAERQAAPAAACRVHRTNAKSSRSNIATHRSQCYIVSKPCAGASSILPSASHTSRVRIRVRVLPNKAPSSELRSPVAATDRPQHRSRDDCQDATRAVDSARQRPNTAAERFRRPAWHEPRRVAAAATGMAGVGEERRRRRGYGRTACRANPRLGTDRGGPRRALPTEGGLVCVERVARKAPGLAPRAGREHPND